MLKGKFKIMGLLILMIGLSFEELHACVCANEPETVETAEYEHYDEIFLGELISIRYFKVRGLYEDDNFALDGVEYIFEVSKKWKGNSDKLVTIKELTNSCSISCEFSNGKWLIGAFYGNWVMPVKHKDRSKSFLQSNGCKLNIHYYNPDTLKADIAKLDQIFPKEIQLTNTMNSLKMAFVFGIVALLLSFFVYLKLKI